jgi:hypothetical protein
LPSMHDNPTPEIHEPRASLPMSPSHDQDTSMHQEKAKSVSRGQASEGAAPPVFSFAKSHGNSTVKGQIADKRLPTENFPFSEANAPGFPSRGAGQVPSYEEEKSSSDSPESLQEMDPCDPLEGGSGAAWFLEPAPPSTTMAIPLMEEQWPSALHEGILSSPDGKIHGFDPNDPPPPWASIVVHVNVALCYAEGLHIFRDSSGLYTHGSTRGILAPKYFERAIDLQMGAQIFPDDVPPLGMENGEEAMPSPESPNMALPAPLPPVFPFQRESPLEERAAYRRQFDLGCRSRSAPYSHPTSPSTGRQETPLRPIPTASP